MTNNFVAQRENILQKIGGHWPIIKIVAAIKCSKLFEKLHGSTFYTALHKDLITSLWEYCCCLYCCGIFEKTQKMN